MCKMVFIGTNLELAEIPWNENKKDFHVQRISDEFKDVARHFRTENIYSVGTSEGCGCNFVLKLGWFGNKDEEREGLNFVAQTNKLVDLITNNASKENEVELYCCWAGDYASDLEDVETIQISGDDFRSRFNIEERKLMRFV
jgi:hypothetical protein